MVAKDAEYYAQRAREERATAAQAADPKVAAIHLDLAIKFDALARVAAAGSEPTTDEEEAGD